MGQTERIARNRGMGLIWQRPCYSVSMPHVDKVVREETTGVGGGLLGGGGKSTTIVEWHTPLGMLSEKIISGAGTGEDVRQYSWEHVWPWTVERLVKKPEDYEILKFIVEDMKYSPNYFPVKQAKDYVKDEGLVVTFLPYSPLQQMMIWWVGTPRFYIHYARYRKKVEEVYQALDEKYEELYPIVADSPADWVNLDDNIDGVLVTPTLFERYFIPAYEKAARVLHERGKIMVSHMDGRLGALKNLIAKCPQDGIEAFHPPPMGDLPIHEALTLWKDKFIAVGYPGSVLALGPEAVKKHLLNLLRSVIPGDRIILIASTENLVPDDCLLAMTDIMEKATLPLSKESVDKIQRETLSEKIQL